MLQTYIKTILSVFLIGLASLCQSKNIEIATVQSMQVGDRACYVDLLSDAGQIYQNLADFEVCDQRHLIGQRVNLSYEKTNVMAASCNGDMDCQRTDTIWLIKQISKIQTVTPTQNKRLPSHCFNNEQIIFSCSTKSNKVISICSSLNLNRNNGYMQYRFGSIGSFPEFVYPMNHARASEFFYSGNLTYAGGGGAYLKFINANYQYIIYTGIGHGWDKQGVVIKDGIEEISGHSCREPWTSEIGPELFNQAGLSPDSSEFEIPN